METILTSHKMRFYPNEEQIQIIETTFGTTRKMGITFKGGNTHGQI